MQKKIKEHWLSWRIKYHRAVRITFTGGLGAQVLSTAIYYHFVERGFHVMADLSYFENSYRIAIPGQKGQISIWNWEMECYGISCNSLELTNVKGMYAPTLRDGILKSSLALEALASPSVRSKFNTIINDEYSLAYRSEKLNSQPYLCVHVRRGDYLNVASHLVSSNMLDNLASKFAGLIQRVLILSDSPISPDEFRALRKNFQDRIHIIDHDPNPALAHSLMRNAKVLVCSNSQFSLSAGLLSDGLVILPKVWYGKGGRHLNNIIDNSGDFLVLRKT